MTRNVSLLRELVENIRETGMEWARKRRELAALQNRRKIVHLGLRDRLIAEAQARGEAQHHGGDGGSASASMWRAWTRLR